jgi:pimeloyl-ACP methyl ester carboxylesterase
VPEQWEVKSGDGGSIAVWVEGDGPPLVLVHGSVSDHAAFAPLVGELRDEFTIFAMDRRGFGGSRDGPTTRRPSASSATSRRSWSGALLT